jgi:hypothetical protein
MSLTSLLHRQAGPNAVSDFFATQLPNLDGVRQRFKDAGPITLPRLGPVRRAGTVGTAFDYRAREWFPATGPRELVAAHGGANLFGRYLSSLSPTDGVIEVSAAEAEANDPYRRLAAARTAFLEEHLPAGRLLDGEDERRLCRFCLALALFDPIFRSGHYPPELMAVGTRATVEDLLGIATDEEVDDLCALSAAFGQAFGPLLDRPCHLNPVFAGSRDVGGADADLIVDGCLVDMKAVTGKFERWWTYQLVGYVLLDYDDHYGIDQVGFYFARHPALIVWDLPELLAELAGGPVDLTGIRGLFREAVDTVRGESSRRRVEELSLAAVEGYRRGGGPAGSAG